jgi:hypothetical protein
MRSLQAMGILRDNSMLKSWVAACMGVVMLLLSGFVLLGPGGRDDVYKTLWVAEAFAQTGKVINYNGDAIEQSSSLLHVIILGGLRSIIGGSLADLNLALTVLCGGLGVFLTVGLARRLGLQSEWLLAATLGVHGTWVYWSMGGLDGVISADCWLFFLWMLLPSLKGGRWSMLLLAIVLLVLARPENGLIALGALGLYLLLQFWIAPRSALDRTPKHVWIVLGMILGAFLGLVAWRLWHGGHWLPQSALAKTDGFHVSRLRQGLGYLWLESYRHPELFPLWIAMGVGAWRILRRRSLSAGVQMLYCIVGMGLCFVAASGGDWMENGRFLVPFLPLLMLNLYLELSKVTVRWQFPLRLGYASLVILGLFWIAAHFNLGYGFIARPTLPAHRGISGLSFAERNNKVHLRDGFPFERMLHAHDRIYALKGEPVTILSQQAGFMMYHLALRRMGQFRFIDLVALCTADFTECAVTRDRGRMRGGLNMDLVYLFDDWDRIAGSCAMSKPDIIFALDDEDLQLAKTLERHGYVVVALQTGVMPQAQGIFQGMEVEAVEFVAVLDRWDMQNGLQTFDFGRE